jgi:hypothetical protein
LPSEQKAAEGQGDLHDRARWEAVVGEFAAELGTPEAADYLVFRWLNQYLPAWQTAARPEARERMWLALWSLLTARATSRKPFQLSPEDADRLVARFRAELE